MSTITLTLTERHQGDLLRSGIPVEIAIQNGVESLTERGVQTVLNRREPVGEGMAFPYPDPSAPDRALQCHSRNGGQVNFTRVRLDQPERALDRDGNPSKYLSRYGSGQQPYIPVGVGAAISAGVDVIYLTEGEKKALCAWAMGFATIGLSGLYGWKEKDKQELLRLLDKFLPAEHTIVVIWDSDAALNVAFAVSTRMLHDILRRRKCMVKVVVLPQTGIHKVGLDDFLVAYGKETFEQLVDSTAPLPVTRQIPVSEFVLSWVGCMATTLKSLTESETTVLLSKSFRKGLVDRLDHDTREQVLKSLQQFTTADVQAIFRASVLDFLQSNYGEVATGSATTNVGIGCTATLPDGDGTRVRVLGVEDGFVWATPAHAKKDSPAFPVPISALKDISAATDEPTAQTAAKFADEFVKQQHMKDGDLTLRVYRDVYFRWAEGTYTETPDTDIRAAVMGYLRHAAPSKAVPKTQAAVEANLKAIGVCHVQSTAPLPCWIEGGQFKAANEIISFTNGNLDVGAVRAGAEDDQIWLKPTPRLFTTIGRSYAFDRSATCPRWQELLNEVLPDPALQALLQEMFGLCQFSDTLFQRFFVFYGPGANAKGVVSEILAATVGLMNVASVPLARFNERFSLWPLTTCLINLVAEIPSADHAQSLRIAEDKLKAIVSGDFIEVERKNKDIVKAAQPPGWCSAATICRPS